MDVENHRYMPVENLEQESYRHGDMADPSRDDESGDQEDRGNPVVEISCYLEHVGEVLLLLTDTHLVCHPVEDAADSMPGDAGLWLCCGNKDSAAHLHLPLSEIFAVEYKGLGPVGQFNPSGFCGLATPQQQMYRIVLHTFQKSESNSCKWVPKAFVFGHSNAKDAQEWVQKSQNLLDHDTRRPKRLLVFINPYGGKGLGVQIWEKVAPLFYRAKVETKVVKTERSGHAHGIMKHASKEELNALDGVIVVGGDGLFNEVLNGLVLHRHKANGAAKPQRTTDVQTHGDGHHKPEQQNGHHSSEEKGEEAVLTDGLDLDESGLQNLRMNLDNSNPDLRLGIIPAGSTDAVVVSTTGARDPVTSALHIILGDSMPLDILRMTGWNKSPEDGLDEKPKVQYAASFTGYGFYGDVTKESESLRWMGPARYDAAGFKVFMKHKRYEAEVSFLDIPHSLSSPHGVVPQGPWTHHLPFTNSNSISQENKKVICRVNCATCAKGPDFSHIVSQHSEEGYASNRRLEGLQAPKWQTRRGKFHSVGAAIMSCRNDKAPDGVAAHAHLADGFLHLILIRECSRPAHLRQLLRLTRKGADPFKFKFVEHHKTPLFTFHSHGKQSVWIVDGELFPAHTVSGQVFRGLVNLFACGPEI
ncbi:unnamed protein product [Sphagnum jensenii]|uniref:DAGKc domain-containing protein n=1 Tax=Sphagnum jensenii TaxID=128206 RepID=A0ABP0W9F7_9BRYO